MNRTRRAFLRRSLGASGLLAFTPTAPKFLMRTAAAANQKDDRDTVLVVIQLAGGNDGLNTIVPHGDDQYARSRPTLRIPTSELHRIDSLLGFHPRLEAIARLYNDGLLSVVQGVGYPNPNGGHPQSMHIWHTADPVNINRETGWVGRLVDQRRVVEPASVPGVFVGTIRQPAALNARSSVVPSLRSIDDAILHGLSGTPRGDDPEWARAAAIPRDTSNNALLAFAQRGALSALEVSRNVEAAATTSQDDYPRLPLAGNLRTIAQLIRADVGPRIYYTEHGGEQPGGFDTHAGQALNHGALLDQLSRSLAAFVQDLKGHKQLDRVLVITFSEFGRTVQENGRKGTDHGSAQPLFLVGGKLRGGLIGDHPPLDVLEGGGQKHHTDFRRVYATAIENWLGFESQDVLGGRFEALDILKS